MKSEEIVLSSMLNRLNIEKVKFNKNDETLKDINEKTKNIKIADAKLNNLLKFNGTDWVPSPQPVSSVADAATAASAASESKGSAEESASQAHIHALTVISEAGKAIAAAARAEKSSVNAFNANDSVNSSLDLISSKANSDNPSFTGTVNLPPGTTIDNESIALQDKIITSAKFIGNTSGHQYHTDIDNDEVALHFDQVHKNNTGTPSAGSTSTIESSSLWGMINITSSSSSVMPGFEVPANKGGIYEISIQVTIDFVPTAPGTLFNIIIYKRMSGTGVDRRLMYNVYNLKDTPNNELDRAQAAVYTLSRRAKDIVLLNDGDQIFAKVIVNQRNATNSDWTIKGDHTYLNIREL